MKQFVYSQCSAGLRDERDHLSHTLFKNRFGGILQPGFSAERLTQRDVVLRALQGDKECLRDALNPALKIWNREVKPAIIDFFNRVSSVYGFETSPEWEEQVVAVRKAVEKLAEFSTSTAKEKAEKYAKSFWKNCDIILEFMNTFYQRYSEYFLTWNPELITKRATCKVMA